MENTTKYRLTLLTKVSTLTEIILLKPLSAVFIVKRPIQKNIDNV